MKNALRRVVGGKKWERFKRRAAFFLAALSAQTYLNLACPNMAMAGPGFREERRVGSQQQPLQQEERRTIQELQDAVRERMNKIRRRLNRVWREADLGINANFIDEYFIREALERQQGESDADYKRRLQDLAEYDLMNAYSWANILAGVVVGRMPILEDDRLPRLPSHPFSKRFVLRILDKLATVNRGGGYDYGVFADLRNYLERGGLENFDTNVNNLFTNLFNMRAQFFAALADSSLSSEEVDEIKEGFKEKFGDSLGESLFLATFISDGVSRFSLTYEDVVSGTRRVSSSEDRIDQMIHAVNKGAQAAREIGLDFMGRGIGFYTLAGLGALYEWEQGTRGELEGERYSARAYSLFAGKAGEALRTAVEMLAARDDWLANKFLTKVVPLLFGYVDDERQFVAFTLRIAALLSTYYGRLGQSTYARRIKLSLVLDQLPQEVEREVLGTGGNRESSLLDWLQRRVRRRGEMDVTSTEYRYYDAFAPRRSPVLDIVEIPSISFIVPRLYAGAPPPSSPQFNRNVTQGRPTAVTHLLGDQQRFIQWIRPIERRIRGRVSIPASWTQREQLVSALQVERTLIRLLSERLSYRYPSFTPLTALDVRGGVEATTEEREGRSTTRVLGGGSAEVQGSAPYQRARLSLQIVEDRVLTTQELQRQQREVLDVRRGILATADAAGIDAALFQVDQVAVRVQEQRDEEGVEFRQQDGRWVTDDSRASSYLNMFVNVVGTAADNRGRSYLLLERQDWEQGENGQRRGSYRLWVIQPLEGGRMVAFQVATGFNSTATWLNRVFYGAHYRENAGEILAAFRFSALTLEEAQENALRAFPHPSSVDGILAGFRSGNVAGLVMARELRTPEAVNVQNVERTIFSSGADIPAQNMVERAWEEVLAGAWGDVTERGSRFRALGYLVRRGLGGGVANAIYRAGSVQEEVDEEVATTFGGEVAIQPEPAGGGAAGAYRRVGEREGWGAAGGAHHLSDVNFWQGQLEVADEVRRRTTVLLKGFGWSEDEARRAGWAVGAEVLFNWGRLTREEGRWRWTTDFNPEFDLLGKLLLIYWARKAGAALEVENSQPLNNALTRLDNFLSKYQALAATSTDEMLATNADLIAARDEFIRALQGLSQQRLALRVDWEVGGALKRIVAVGQGRRIRLNIGEEDRDYLSGSAGASLLFTSGDTLIEVAGKLVILPAQVGERGVPLSYLMLPAVELAIETSRVRRRYDSRQGRWIEERTPTFALRGGGGALLLFHPDGSGFTAYGGVLVKVDEYRGKPVYLYGYAQYDNLEGLVGKEELSGRVGVQWARTRTVVGAELAGRGAWGEGREELAVTARLELGTFGRFVGREGVWRVGAFITPERMRRVLQGRGGVEETRVGLRIGASAGFRSNNFELALGFGFGRNRDLGFILSSVDPTASTLGASQQWGIFRDWSDWQWRALSPADRERTQWVVGAAVRLRF